MAIVATFNPEGWKAWIGAVDELADYQAAADQVASFGTKLSEEDARHFFPDIDGRYLWE